MLSQVLRAPAHDYSMIEPDLATAWSSSADGLTWEFKLRPGVVWHDGSPFTADDVKFTLDRAISPAPSVGGGRAGIVARYASKTDNVQVAGDLTVRVKTDFAAAAFLPALTSVYLSVYPRRATEALQPPSMVLFSSVVGTGPFKAAGAVRGTSYKMVRNDAYYEPGVPYLDGVEFLVMPEPAVRLAALMSHAVDAIAIVTDQEAGAIASGAGSKITVSESPSAGGNTVQMNLARPPFDNILVRRAVDLAISRSDAEKALGAGLAGLIMPPGGPWSLSQAEVALAAGSATDAGRRGQARELLKQAGLPEGFEVEISVRGEPFSQTLGEFAAGQLAQVGIKAKVVPVEFVAYQEMLGRKTFSMIAHSHSFALDDPDAILYDHYSCAGIENYPGLCDPALDSLIAGQSRATDARERRRLVGEIEKAILDAHAKIWFQWTVRRSPVWSNVHGMEPGGPSLYQGRRLDRVWIGPE
jgi:peptide/nickel transport system substrate-binding protein